MRKAIIILFLFVSAALHATTYYVATTGNNSNPGTLSQPWATWNYGFSRLVAGDILYIRGGTYTGVAGGSSNKFGVKADGLRGTSGSHILISAYPGEVPILDGSALNTTSGQNVGIGIYNSSYLDLVGLTVINVTQHAVNAYAAPAFYESNVTYITHTLITVHHCGDGFTLRDSYNYIYYTNCDVYNIADTFDDPSGALPGSLANGFYCAPSPGTHIYYTGCRAWNCSDDGWDFFGGAGYIDFTNCWAFNNGKCPAGGPIASTVGDGSGFKLGPTTASIESGFQRTLKNCIAVGNLGAGIDMNASSTSTNVRHAIYNCVTANNTSDGFQYHYDHVSTFKNNISYGNSSGDEFGTGSTIDHNSWQSGLVASSADFSSTNAAELSAPRKADGSLPDISYMHLVSTSDMKDAGVNVGIPYTGTAPDLGAFELGTGTTPIPPPPPAATLPVIQSTVVENATPSLLALTYDLSLSATLVPAVTAWTVMVNSVARPVSAVTISGTKVQLTLASAVKYGDIITMSYTKPATNPLQTTSGGAAAGFSGRAVTNKLVAPTKDATVTITMTITPTPVHQTINVAIAYSAPFTVPTSEVIRISDINGRLLGEKYIIAGTTFVSSPLNLPAGYYNVFILANGVLMTTQRISVY